MCLENSLHLAMSLYSSVGLLPDSRSGDISQLPGAAVRVDICFCITRDSNHMFLQREEHRNIALQQMSLKRKRTKENPETRCGLQALMEYNEGESGNAYKSNSGMLKLGVLRSKWKTLQKVVENERAG